MYTEKKRILHIMAASVCMNFFLFIIAYYFKLPLWLDTTGTIYASILLGAPSGFVVAIANNLIQAFCFYGTDSLLFYIVSALTAFITGHIMKNKKHNAKNWLMLLMCLFVSCSFVSVILTLITTNGVPVDYWGSMIYQFLTKKEFSPILCTVLSVSLVKFFDIIVSSLFVMIAICLTPKVIKSNTATVKNNMAGNE